MQWFATCGLTRDSPQKLIRNFTTLLRTEVCPNAAIEPHLQLLPGESLRLASAHTDDDGAQLAHLKGS